MKGLWKKKPPPRRKKATSRASSPSSFPFPVNRSEEENWWWWRRASGTFYSKPGRLAGKSLGPSHTLTPRHTSIDDLNVKVHEIMSRDLPIMKRAETL